MTDQEKAEKLNRLITDCMNVDPAHRCNYPEGRKQSMPDNQYRTRDRITWHLEKALASERKAMLEDVISAAESFSRNGMNLGDLHEHYTRQLAALKEPEK